MPTGMGHTARGLALGWLCLVGCGSGASGPVDAGADATAIGQVKILAINDFHGNLESPGSDSNAMPVGGVAHLAAKLEQASLGSDSTIIVSAGDLVGGSPLLSALFHDEPTIEAMNALGLAINAVGNHEFDEDIDELMRMKNGGCHPLDGCYGGDGFAGAEFSMLAANAVDSISRQPIFPAYELRNLGGAQIAFIGLTTVNTPNSTTPITGVEFDDEVATVNAQVAALAGLGIDNVVVVIHEGGYVIGGGENDCVGLSGRIVDIVNGLDPAVDLVISGHTHMAYSCVVDGIPVTSAGAEGRYFSDITLDLDASQTISAVRVINRPVLHDVSPSTSLETLVESYRQLVAPLANQVVGQVTADLTTAVSVAGEIPLGGVVADAMLAATPQSVVAFQQRGGLRANLSYAASPGESGDGQVRYEEAFAVQPFGNLVVSMTLSGQQLHDLLESQWMIQGAAPLQVSASLSYTWSVGSAVGDRIDPAAVFIDGSPLNLTADYRVTTNSFLSTSGFYPVLHEGRDVQTHAVDLDALVAYLQANSPIDPPAPGRINLGP